MSAAELLDLTAEVKCRHCGDKLHRVADERADTWEWADENGRRFGADADLRDLPGGPGAYLARLGDMLARAQAVSSSRAARTWLYWRTAKEYSALKVRLASGTFHEHLPDYLDMPPFEGVVPEHCNWPMRLRPSGWQCRECGERLPA
jgi:hypothetical protein